MRRAGGRPGVLAALRTSAGTVVAGLLVAGTLFAGLALHQTPARADTPPVQIVDFGIYSVTVVRHVDAPETVAGARNVVADVVLKHRTRDILAIPGRSFGYRYRLDPSLFGEQITIRLTYPPMTNPETGRTATSQEKSFTAVPHDEPIYDGYRFDHGWEMAEGKWVFEILHRGMVLARQDFNVVVALN